MNYQDFLKQEQEKRKDLYFGFSAEGYENGKTVLTNKRVFPRENNPFIKINSTLLIPEKYYEFFQRRIIEHKGVRAYIAYLLFKYRLHIATGMVPTYRNFTTKYQEKDQNLIKVSFRPRVDDWTELKLYRVSFGLSISAFLVYLLIADSVDFAQTVSYFLGAVGIP